MAKKQTGLSSKKKASKKKVSKKVAKKVTKKVAAKPVPKVPKTEKEVQTFYQKQQLYKEKQAADFAKRFPRK